MKSVAKAGPRTVAPPDVLLVSAHWQSRALVRAQLIEEGFDVVATSSWPVAKRHLTPGVTPRMVIVDVRDLPQPEAVLDELKTRINPEQVLVLGATATVSPQVLGKLGYRVLRRPVAIRTIIAAASRLIERAKRGR
jgi:DNA-binding response OmpR family regulator